MLNFILVIDVYQYIKKIRVITKEVTIVLFWDTMSSEKLYQPTDTVLAKVKGYPAWPAMIIPTELIPSNVLKGHSIDDSDSEESDDENYLVYSSTLKFRKFSKLLDTYCVKFMKDDSYIWVKPNDLSELTVDDCEKWLHSKGKKQKKLIPAYEMALQALRDKSVDVWEFVEYGSNGKPDDDDYVDEEEERSKPKRRGTRSSARQRQKQKAATFDSDLNDLDSEEDNSELEITRTTRKKRNTRSKRVADELDEPLIELEVSKKKPTREPTITQTRKKNSTKPKMEKYNYEDDEDWALVGLGPQDTSITSNMNPIVYKLTQKKNLERHNETKLDLIDKISSINKLLLDIFDLDPGSKHNPIKDDYEIILDELDIALSIKGSQDEFISLFRSNNEILSLFRLLFNLKGTDLEKWHLWDQFQNIYNIIYDGDFIPDKVKWSLQPVSDDPNQTAKVKEE